MTDQHTRQDPTEQYPKALEGEQLDHPGLEADMRISPDFGEETYKGSGKLQGRRAVVTGGDSGIGRAVALAFAREGADVVLAFLEEEADDARKTAEVVEAAGRKAVTMPGDLQDASYCQALIQRSVDELGGIDIL